MNLSDLHAGIRGTFGFFSRKKDAPGKAAHIILCNDYHGLHKRGKSIVRKLRRKGHDVHIHCVNNQRELFEHLQKREKKGLPAPTAVFLDVGGVGEPAAVKVIAWYEKNFPGKPLPAINFLSLDVGMGITEAGRLRRSDGRVEAGFVDEMELIWLDRHLGWMPGRERAPVSTAFRDVLNGQLGLALPLDHDPGYYADSIKSMQKITNDSVLGEWQKGRLPAAEVLTRMRGYALGLAEALRSGFYGGAAGDGAGDLRKDGEFYGSTGFPVKGPAVFTLADVEKTYYKTRGTAEGKPVLVMQSYDPAVMPVLASGMLGGLVVTSPYMASHLKLLCETHMVSGLFGLVPPGDKTARRDFNEDAKPQLPPYYEGDAAEIAGHKLKKGQPVLVALGGDGLSLDPPTRVEAPPADLGAIEENEKLRQDLRNLQQINDCFAAFFGAAGQPVHGVKANLDGNTRRLLAHVRGVGLVRTEQMVATGYGQRELLRDILLNDDKPAADTLSAEMHWAYMDIIRQLDRGHPVKIRLFDFVHGEILTKEEQKPFIEKYGRLDIHGGAALETWPELYRRQAATILSALQSANIWSDRPLEIMMPAVRTEEDTLRIKQVIEEEAEKLGIPRGKFSFGVMVETLDACKNIGAIAPHCDFISFGTNDLTQQFFGISRSDLKAQTRFAERHGYDPFRKLSPDVLALMRETATAARAARPGLKVDVCGQQGADLETAEALFRSGVDNVSVAPNLANLYALPTLLNYRALDRLYPALAAEAKAAPLKNAAGA